LAGVSDTKSRIVEEATRLFASQGYEATTTAAIARESGVGEGSIYYHFNDKKDLFIACLHPHVDEMIESLEAELSAAQDKRSVLRTILSLRYRFIQDHKDVVKIMMAEGSHHPELRAMFVKRVALDRWDRFHSALKRLFLPDVGQEERLSMVLILGVTAMIWGFIEHGEQFRQVYGDMSGIEIPGWEEGQLDILTDFVLHGIEGMKKGGAGV
jgi:AcrR family transcriptional regulator